MPQAEQAPTAPPLGGLEAALARGVAAKADWARTGEVVPLAAVAAAWGLPAQKVDAAIGRGELFAVALDGNSYVPCEFLQLDSVTVGAVCQALQGLDSLEELIFWKRRHGALGGATVFDTLLGDSEQGLQRVTQLARIHAAEAAGQELRQVTQLARSFSAPRD